MRRTVLVFIHELSGIYQRFQFITLIRLRERSDWPQDAMRVSPIKTQPLSFLCEAHTVHIYLVSEGRSSELLFCQLHWTYRNEKDKHKRTRMLKPQTHSYQHQPYINYAATFPQNAATPRACYKESLPCSAMSTNFHYLNINSSSNISGNRTTGLKSFNAAVARARRHPRSGRTIDIPSLVKVCIMRHVLRWEKGADDPKMVQIDFCYDNLCPLLPGNSTLV